MNLDPQQHNDIIARWNSPQSIRSIARELGLGRHVVARVIAQHLQRTGRADDPAPPASLGKIPLTRKRKLDPFVEQLKELLERYPNLTAQRALEELRKLGYAGGYSTLRCFIKQQRVKPKARTVRFETAPGAQAQMDWSTYTLDFTQEGRRRVELFSYILGYSRRQYIHFTERQDLETTMRQHIAAFEHLGGVAATCLYDNMKVVVTRWEDGQPVYNTRFLAFATHYGYKPWACRARRPETKGKVERPFYFVETNLLNGRTFRSLEHLNEVARWWLAEVNDRRLHGGTKRTPLELHAEEKPHLLALPALRFDTAQVVYRIADTEGFINYANNRYSVPWRLIGQSLPVRITEDELQIYNASLEAVAKHGLLQGTGGKQTDPAHNPPKDNQEQIETLRQRYAQWGQTGSEYLEGLLAKCRYGKHEAQRVLSLLFGYPKQDALTAMSRGIQYHAYGYQSLERILAHIGTPKAGWEILSQREQERLQQLTDSTRTEARRSEEYQQLIDHQRDEDGRQTQTTQPTPTDQPSPAHEPTHEPTHEPSHEPTHEPSHEPTHERAAPSTTEPPRENPPVLGDSEDQGERPAA